MIIESKNNGLHGEALPSAVSSIIDRLVTCAMSDRRGIFWPVGAEYRQGARPGFDNSLGYGTPGILLLLTEYYAATGDARVLDLLEKGMSWVTAKVESTPFLHGLYAGTPGVWFVLDRLEKTLPALVPREWRSTAIDALVKRRDTSAGANIATGLAGTVVGALCSLNLEGEELAKVVIPLTEQLIATAKPSMRGVYWDFTPTSIQAPVGFLQGSAGVDFALAHVSSRLGPTYLSVLSGSLNHARFLYDEKRDNWLDQDAPASLKILTPDEVDRHLASGGLQELCAMAVPEDSLSWGTGTTGILLSRAHVARAYSNTFISDLAAEDLARATRKLCLSAAERIQELDCTVQNGAAGLLLVARDLQLRAGLASAQEMRLLSGAALDRLKNYAAAEAGDDSSLLTGRAGVAYSLLLARDGVDTHSAVSPLGSPCLGAPALGTTGSLQQFLEQRFPAMAERFGLADALSKGTLCLSRIEDVASTQIEKSEEEMLQRAMQHELRMYKQLESLRFRTLFWKELVRRRLFAAVYRDMSDQQLLFQYLRLDASVELIELDFDPRARPPKSVPGGTLVLRHATANGIAETSLSGLQYSLLRRFERREAVLVAVVDVASRVDAPDVSQSQLAELGVKLVRGFIAAGYLQPAKAPIFKRLSLRLVHGRTARALFPSLR